jgi:hypothetical protein
MSSASPFAMEHPSPGSDRNRGLRGASLRLEGTAGPDATQRPSPRVSPAIPSWTVPPGREGGRRRRRPRRPGWRRRASPYGRAGTRAQPGRLQQWPRDEPTRAACRAPRRRAASDGRRREPRSLDGAVSAPIDELRETAARSHRLSTAPSLPWPSARCWISPKTRSERRRGVEAGRVQGDLGSRRGTPMPPNALRRTVWP